MTCFNKLCNVSRIICIPCKFFCKFITNNLQRPYSFCFLINFFILMTPSLLLTVILTQFSEYFILMEKFNYIFYSTLINLIINFVTVFHIYDVYGKHELEEIKPNYTVSSFVKNCFKFLFTEGNKLGYIGIYYFLQIGLYSVNLYYLFTVKDFNSDKFQFTAVIIFTKFATICGLVFTLSHVLIYVSLFFVILCAINNSCLCALNTENKNGLEITASSKNKNVTVRDSQEHLKRNNYGHSKAFFIMILDCYKFLGLYDHNRYLDIGYATKDDVFQSNGEV
jgi:hypothetical protein